MDYPKHPMVMEGKGLEKVCSYNVKEGILDLSKCPHTLEKRDF